MRLRVVIAAIALGAATSLAAQQSGPSFKTGIDVLTIEATVVDGDSRPVTDLSAADFDVTIAGDPRRVMSVRYVEANPTTPLLAAGDIVPSHTSNQGAPPGRIVAFVVDRDAIGSGNERAVLEAATSMLDALGSADAAGAGALPDSSIELTRDKDRVKAALLRMTGTRPRTPMQFEDRKLSWDEALGYERQDPRIIAEVVERECRQMKLPPGMINHCPDDLVALSVELLQTGRAQLRQTMSALRALLRQLATLRGSKHLVLLSGGMPFGQDLLDAYNTFARDAATADVMVHAIYLEAERDIANRKLAATSPFGGREFMTGLGTLTSMTGGAFYQASGSGAGIFARITSAMTGFYQIGIETTPVDRAGPSRQIDLGVRRQGVVVRHGRRAVTPESATGVPADRLAALLQQPTDIAELPIGVATYTTRGDDPDTLRVLISAEVAAPRTSLEWGFIAFNEGNAVASGRQRIDPAAGMPPSGTLSGKLLAGRYRLRAAAIDGDGRAAVIDLPLSVGLRAAGALQFSDVILGLADADGRLQARSSFEQSQTIFGLVEILSADPSVLERTRALFEIAQAGAAEPLKRFQMAVRSGASASLINAQIQASAAGLLPGVYVATVIPHVDGEPVGRVSRRFEITAKP